MINQTPTPTPTDNFPVPTPTNIPFGSSEILWSNHSYHKIPIGPPPPRYSWYCTQNTCGCIPEDGGGYASLSVCQDAYEASKCSDMCKSSSNCCDETPTPSTPSRTPMYTWYCTGGGCGCVEEDGGGWASKPECDADYEANKCSDMCDSECCCEDCFYNVATGETNCGTGKCKCDCPLCTASGNNSGEVLGGCDCKDCFLNVATGETNCGTGECSCECDTCEGTLPCASPTPSPSTPSPSNPSPSPSPSPSGTTPSSPSPTGTSPTPTPTPTPSHTPCDPVVDGPCASIYACDNAWTFYGCSKKTGYGWFNQPGEGCFVFTSVSNPLLCAAGSSLVLPTGVSKVENCDDDDCKPTPTSPTRTESPTPTTPSPTESNSPSTPSPTGTTPTETCTPECCLYMPCSSQTASDLIVEYKCSKAASAFLYNQECHVQADGVVDCGTVFFSDPPGTPIVGCNDTRCNPITSPTPSTPTPSTPTTYTRTPTSPSDTPTSPTPTSCSVEIAFQIRGLEFEFTGGKGRKNLNREDGAWSETWGTKSIECTHEKMCPDNDCESDFDCDAINADPKSAGGGENDECECSDTKEEKIELATYTTSVSTDCNATCERWPTPQMTKKYILDCEFDAGEYKSDCCMAESTPGSCSGGGSCSDPTTGLTFSGIGKVQKCGSCDWAWGSGCSPGDPPTSEDQDSAIVTVPVGQSSQTIIDFSGGSGSFHDTTTGSVCDPAGGFCYALSIDIEGYISCDSPVLRFAGTAKASTTDKQCSYRSARDFCGGGGNVTGMAFLANQFGICTNNPGYPPMHNSAPCNLSNGSSVDFDSVSSMRDPTVQNHCASNPTDPCCSQINQQMNWVTNARNCPGRDDFCNKYAGCPADTTEDIDAAYTFKTCSSTSVDYAGVCFTSSF